MANAERSVTLYQGSPLEVVGTRGLIIPEGERKEPRFFIPEDIVVSRYGVAGFLMIDKKPEERWISYTDREWTGVGYQEDGVEMLFHDNKSHYLNTDLGFKMIRYFILPPNVDEFFKRDKFLGDPLIDKCCREGTLPEEFDEDEANTDDAFGSGRHTGGGEELIESVIKTVLPDLTEEQTRLYGYGHGKRAYVSFHRWQEFKYVIGEGQQSIYAAMNNFDNVIARFDIKRVLEARELLPDAPNTSALESEIRILKILLG